MNELCCAGKADITGPAADVNLMVSQIVGLTETHIAPACLYAARCHLSIFQLSHSTGRMLGNCEVLFTCRDMQPQGS